MRLRMAVLPVIAGLLALTACGGGGGSDDPTATPPPAATTEEGSGSPTIDAIKARGSMRVGVSDRLLGVSYQDPATGKHTGFDVRIAELIITGFGLDAKALRLRSTTPTTSLSTLNSGDIDLALGGLKTSADKQIGLVGPYLAVQQDLLVRATTNPVTSAAQLAGKKVCVFDEAGAGAKVREAKVTDQVVAESSADKCIAQLRAGTVDAFSSDSAVLASHAAASKGELRVLGKALSTDGYHVGFRARDKELRTRVTEILRKAVQDGTWLRLYQESFGTDGPAPKPPEIK